LFYLRLNKDYGHLIALISQCLKGIVPFTLFFFGSMMFFSLIDQMMCTDMYAHDFFHDSSEFMHTSKLNYAWENSLHKEPPGYLSELAEKS